MKTFWVRYVVSGMLLAFASYIVVGAAIDEQTDLSFSDHWVVQLIVLLFCGSLLFALEGSQLAVVGLLNQHPESFRKSHPIAFRVHSYVHTFIPTDDIDRLGAYLQGRQLLTVISVWFLAKTTSQPDLTTLPLTDVEIPSWFKSIFFEQGLFGVIVVVQLFQLLPQHISASYPVDFLNGYAVSFVVYLCIFVYHVGITAVSIPLGYLVEKYILRYRTTGPHTDGSTGPREFTTVISPTDRPEGHALAQRGTEIRGELRSALLKLAAVVHEGRVKHRTGTRVVGPDEISNLAEERNHATAAVPPTVPESQEVVVPVVDGEDLSLVCVVEGGASDGEPTTSRRSTITSEKGEVQVDLDTVEGDADPHLYYNFPIMIGGVRYESPQSFAEMLNSRGLPTPRFLLPISHEDHIPPHIAAMQMLQLIGELVHDRAPVGASAVQIENVDGSARTSLDTAEVAGN